MATKAKNLRNPERESVILESQQRRGRGEPTQQRGRGQANADRSRQRRGARESRRGAQSCKRDDEGWKRSQRQRARQFVALASPMAPCALMP